MHTTPTKVNPLRVITLLVVCMMFSPLVFAQTPSYNNTGTGVGDYQIEGEGGFSGKDGETLTRQSQGLTEPLLIPITADLDGDGSLEIAQINGDTLLILEGLGLNALASVDFNSAVSNRYGSIFAYDIDGDSFNEIIISEDIDGDITILNYSNSNVQVQATLVIGSSHASGGETMVSCWKPNECAVVYTDRTDSCTGSNNCRGIYAKSFDSSGFTSAEVIIDETGSVSEYGVMCLPKFRTMPVGNYDGDSQLEYAFTYAEVSGSGAILPAGVYWRIMENVTVTHNGFESEDFYEQAPTSCQDPAVKIEETFTQPIIFNFDPSFPSAQEVLFAMQIGAEQNEIYEFKQDGSREDLFPSGLLSDGEGRIISNLMRIHAFASVTDPSKINRDVCVLGFDSSDDELSLLCASKVVSGFESDNFRSPAGNLGYNLTSTYRDYASITHATEQDNSNNIHELINSYGIWKIDDSAFDIFGARELERVFTSPIESQNAIYPVDIESFGSDDLIGIDADNIFTIDDGLSNGEADLLNITFDPCLINSVIKENTTVQATMRIIDTNEAPLTIDSVSAQLTAYKGNLNEQVVYSVNKTSGVEFQLSFLANQSSLNNQLEVIARESGASQDDEFFTTSFDVAGQGLEFGTGNKCTIGLVEVEEGVSVSVAGLEILGNNSVKGVFDEIGAPAGLSAFPIYLLVLVAFLGLLIYKGATSRDPNDFKMIMPVSLIFTFFWLIFGFFVNIIPATLIITIFIFIIIASVIWLMSRLSNN